MLKPKILVTTAGGKTGFATALQLLEQGYPVRAMVRTTDRRSEKLRQLGAEIFEGNLADITAMRQALTGVQRAYYCAPFLRDVLALSLTFAVAAQENKLEMVTVMSQWLADPASPSVHTREVWLADKLFSWMPDVATVTVNPGWFADNYRAAGLDVIAQTGIMMLPLGEGFNAPPSNEDIARVIVATLTNPAPHFGKTYRPTGPRLLSPHDIAETFGKVLGRKVKYVDGSTWLVPKVLRNAGIVDYQIAQVLTYLEEYRRNAFAIGAPTNAVFEVTGRVPEDFETIARRYMTATPNSQRNLSGFSKTLLSLMRAMVTPGLSLATYHRRCEIGQIQNARFAGDSTEWRETHESNFGTEVPAPTARAS
jgi:NAD(P)H dehydrogenase (quinone)